MTAKIFPLKKPVLNIKVFSTWKLVKLNLLLLALVFTFVSAVAQGLSGLDMYQFPTDAPQISNAAEPDAPTLALVMTKVVGTVGASMNSLRTTPALAGVSDTLLYSLAAIVLAWGLMKGMIEGSGINSVVSELIPVVMTIAIVTAMTSGVGSIVQTLDNIASAISGRPGGNLTEDLGNGVQKGLIAVDNLLRMPSTNSTVTIGFDIGKALGVFGSFIIVVIAKVIAAFFIIASVGIYCGNIVMAYFAITLAIAMAPVMIPWLMLRPMAWLFDGWLKFTIGAGFLKIVAMFALSLTDKLMSGLVELSEQAKVAPDADWATIQTTSMVVAVGLVLIAGLCAYIMMQTPQLAMGLLQGSAGGAGFTGLRSIVSTPTARMGGQALSSAGSQSMQAAGSAAAGAAGVASAMNLAHSAAPVVRSAAPSNPTEAWKAMPTAQEKFGTAGAAVFRAMGGVETPKPQKAQAGGNGGIPIPPPPPPPASGPTPPPTP